MKNLLKKLKKRLFNRNGLIIEPTGDYQETLAPITNKSNIIYNRRREQIEFERIIAENEEQGLDTYL